MSEISVLALITIVKEVIEQMEAGFRRWEDHHRQAQQGSNLTLTNNSVLTNAFFDEFRRSVLLEYENQQNRREEQVEGCVRDIVREFEEEFGVDPESLSDQELVEANRINRFLKVFKLILDEFKDLRRHRERHEKLSRDDLFERFAVRARRETVEIPEQREKLAQQGHQDLAELRGVLNRAGARLTRLLHEAALRNPEYRGSFRERAPATLEEAAQFVHRDVREPPQVVEPDSSDVEELARLEARARAEAKARFFQLEVARRRYDEAERRRMRLEQKLLQAKEKRRQQRARDFVEQQRVFAASLGERYEGVVPSSSEYGFEPSSEVLEPSTSLGASSVSLGCSRTDMAVQTDDVVVTMPSDLELSIPVLRASETEEVPLEVGGLSPSASTQEEESGGEEIQVTGRRVRQLVPGSESGSASPEPPRTPPRAPGRTDGPPTSPSSSDSSVQRRRSGRGRGCRVRLQSPDPEWSPGRRTSGLEDCRGGEVRRSPRLAGVAPEHEEGLTVQRVRRRRPPPDPSEGPQPPRAKRALVCTNRRGKRLHRGEEEWQVKFKVRVAGLDMPDVSTVVRLARDPRRVGQDPEPLFLGHPPVQVLRVAR